MTDGTIVDKSDAAYAGQAGYTKVSLSIYDPLALGLTFPVFWRCPGSRILNHYNEHVSGRHLDVGVGTGYFLDNCRFPVAKPEITLMDLNPNSLAKTMHRLERFKPVTHQGNALSPWTVPGAPFDSVAMTNILHCLPGNMPDKKPAFAHARSALAPGGTFFGTTVLGENVDHKLFSRLGLSIFTRIGGFSAWNDSPEALEACLAENFDSYEVEMCGVMGVFVGHVKA